MWERRSVAIAFCGSYGLQELQYEGVAVRGGCGVWQSLRFGVFFWFSAKN